VGREINQNTDESAPNESLPDGVIGEHQQASIRPEKVDALIEHAVFGSSDDIRQKHQRIIRELASGLGIFPASIQGLYEAAGKGLYQGITVPAMNIRGLTYQVARSVFKAALKHGVGAFIFEIARSEIGYIRNSPFRDRLYRTETKRICDLYNGGGT
jgi:hypothetical protein